MNRLDAARRSHVISCLVDGCSVRATVRITGVCKKAVLRPLVDTGRVAAEYQDRVFRNIRPRQLQIDEIWSWIECKRANLTPEILERNPHAGDVWLWACIDRETKAVLAHRVGSRDAHNAVRVHARRRVTDSVR